MGNRNDGVGRAVEEQDVAVYFVDVVYVGQVVVLYFCLWSHLGVLEHAGEGGEGRLQNDGWDFVL